MSTLQQPKKNWRWYAFVLMWYIILFLVRPFFRLRYKIRLHDFNKLRTEANRKQGIFFLSNHPALLDPVIFFVFLAPRFFPRPIIALDQLTDPVSATIGVISRAITLEDLSIKGRSVRDAVKKVIADAAAYLAFGEDVLLYPSGRLYRTGEEQLRNSSAAWQIMQSVPDARIVLVRSHGFWGSTFSYACGERPSLFAALGRGIITLLGNGIFFSPRRTIDFEYIEPSDLRSLPDRQSFNRCLEAYYNALPTEPILVPRFFWSKTLL